MIIKTSVGAEVEVPEPMSNEAGRVYVDGDMVYLEARVDEALRGGGVSALNRLVVDAKQHPDVGRYLPARGTVKGKTGKDVLIRLDTRPALCALVDNRTEIEEAIRSANSAIRDAEIAEGRKQDEELREQMRAKAEELAKLIPEGHIRCDYKMHSNYDSGDWAEYIVGGIPVDHMDITFHGWACAIRPGAMNSFDSIPVASISPESLAEARARHQEKQAANAERQAKMDAEKARREDLKAKVACRVIRRGVEINEERDPYAVGSMTGTETGETLELACRNIFDAGYAVNPRYSVVPGAKPGGLAIEGKWNLWPEGNVRALTEFEQLCLDYLHTVPPITNEMRI